MMKNLKHTEKASSLAIMLAAVLLTPAAHAQQVTLADGNSSAVVNVNSDAGMSQWLVDGVNNLQQQWFWYRVGSGLQSPINAISSANYTQSSASTLDTLYANANYGIEINYTLTGGGTGSADIGEGITIHNYSASALNISFYQYSHFTLLNTTGDSVVMNSSEAYQTKGPNQIAEGIISPSANEYEAELNGVTLNKLQNTPNLVLSDDSQAGPGDVTWAYQWDLTIDPNSSIDITKDKLLNIQVVPEPPTFIVAALGFFVILSLRLFRSRKQAHSN